MKLTHTIKQMMSLGLILYWHQDIKLELGSVYYQENIRRNDCPNKMKSLGILLFELKDKRPSNPFLRLTPCITVSLIKNLTCSLSE